MYWSVFCSRTTLEAEYKQNQDALKHNGFKVAYCPDWRGTSEGKAWYSGPLVQYYRDMVANAGGRLIVLGFNDRPNEWKNKIHGLIIPGGRDMDPRFYGQENTASKFDKTDAELRWNFCKAFVTECAPTMPIFGICYGCEVINCILGGDMVQSIPKRHSSKKTINVQEGSELALATGLKSLKGQCYHHQCLGKLGVGIEPIAWDSEDKQVHAYVYKGTKENPRDILAVLWHPEAIYEMEKIEKHDKVQLSIFTHYFKKCERYEVASRGNQKH